MKSNWVDPRQDSANEHPKSCWQPQIDYESEDKGRVLWCSFQLRIGASQLLANISLMPFLVHGSIFWCPRCNAVLRQSMVLQREKIFVQKARVPNEGWITITDIWARYIMKKDNVVKERSNQDRDSYILRAQQICLPSPEELTQPSAHVEREKGIGLNWMQPISRFSSFYVWWGIHLRAICKFFRFCFFFFVLLSCHYHYFFILFWIYFPVFVSFNFLFNFLF